MQDINRPFLIKALESLSGADSELAGGRYNNCVNRCYYACFQAAIDALLREDIRPQGAAWSHSFVPSQFDGLLIHRRKRYGQNCVAYSQPHTYCDNERTTQREP